MNICESLVTSAKIWAESVAVVFDDSKLTYSELNDLSTAAAGLLREAGVMPGDRVALMLPNTPSFIVWYYGALRMGAIVVSISTRLADTEAAFVLDDSGASALIAPRERLASLQDESLTTFADDFEGLVAHHAADRESNGKETFYEATPDTAALILYTSGTTGFPKGATLSHGNVRSNVAAFNHLCNMRPKDKILLAVPLFHCFGQNALLNSALNVGATLVLQEKFDLNETKRLIGTHQVSQLFGVPMMFQLLLDACTPGELASVNYCFSAAATLPIQTGSHWLSKFKLPIHEGYGLTETSPFASYNHRDKYKLGSIGTPIDAVEIKIVDTETGETCSPGELGEIAIRGPNVMLGYWNRPEDTAAAIRNGWFFSGDIGQIDDDGYFYIVDRVKDMIAVGGLKVFPAEVERVLLDPDSVSQVAVVGSPDSIFGEHVVAFVVMADGVDIPRAVDDIASHANANLGNYKVPRKIIPIEELPRNPSGKVLKTRLRELAADPGKHENAAAGNASTSIAEVSQERASGTRFPPELRLKLAAVHASDKQRIASEYVAEIVRQICDMDEMPAPETRFLDAGLDSLLIVEMHAQIQAEIGSETTLPATLVFDCPRIVDLADFLIRTIDDHMPPSCETTQQSMSNAEQIESMSEDEALAALIRELDSN